MEQNLLGGILKIICILLLLIPVGFGSFLTLRGGGGLRRLSLRLRGFESVTRLDGATCLKAKDGSVMIRPLPDFYRAGLLVVVGSGLLGGTACILLLVWSVLTGSAPLGEVLSSGAAAFVVFAALMGPLLLAVMKSPRRRPSFRFNTASRTLEIDCGPESKQVPFSDILHIVTTPFDRYLTDSISRISSKELLLTGLYLFTDLPLVSRDQIAEISVRIWAVLSNGQEIFLGSVSGMKRNTQARATTITQLIMAATGKRVYSTYMHP